MFATKIAKIKESKKSSDLRTKISSLTRLQASNLAPPGTQAILAQAIEEQRKLSPLERTLNNSIES